MKRIVFIVLLACLLLGFSLSLVRADSSGAEFYWQKETVFWAERLTLISPPLSLSDSRLGFLALEQSKQPDKPAMISFRLRYPQKNYSQPQTVLVLSPDWRFGGGSAVAFRGEIISAFVIGRPKDNKTLIAGGIPPYLYTIDIYAGIPQATAQEESGTGGQAIAWFLKESLVPETENGFYLASKWFVDSQNRLHSLLLEAELTNDNLSFSNIEELLEAVKIGEVSAKLRVKHFLFPEGLEGKREESIVVETGNLVEEFALREADERIYLVYQELVSDERGFEVEIKQREFLGNSKWEDVVNFDIPGPIGYFEVDEDYMVVTHGLNPQLTVSKLGPAGVVHTYSPVERWVHGGPTDIAAFNGPHIITTEHQRGTPVSDAQISYRAWDADSEIWQERKNVGSGYALDLKVGRGKWLDREGNAPPLPINVLYIVYGYKGTHVAYFAYPGE